ncbi:hypothetical protein HDU84_007961, partial [Entophlyctis sp. JEL0112]
NHEDFAVRGISKLEYRSPSVGSDTCLTPTQTPLGKRIRSSSVAATTTATPQSVAMALLSMSFKPAASPAAGGSTPAETSTPMILDNSMGENYVLVDDPAADPSSPEAAPSAAAPDSEDAIAALLQLQFGFPSGPPTVLAPNPVSSQSEDKASRKIMSFEKFRNSRPQKTVASAKPMLGTAGNPAPTGAEAESAAASVVSPPHKRKHTFSKAVSHALIECQS